MAELKDLLKYLPEAVGYFQGRRAINQEIDRLRNQDPVQIDRLQMDPATSAAFRRANTRGDVEQQTNIDRQVQEAIRRNPRNVAKVIEAGRAASAKAANTDEEARLASLKTAATLADRLNARNMAIDERNALRERIQENAVAAAEANRTRLDMRGLGTLGDLVGDAVEITPRERRLDPIPLIDPKPLELKGIDLIPIEEREPIRPPQPVGTFEEILAAAKREDELNRLNRNPTSGLDPESLGLEQYTQPFRMSPIPGEDYVEGGAVVTPDGYDHDGVDINMTDAESGRFLGSVESAEMIVNAEDTEEGLKLAKKNPNNPLSKWYLELTERFRKEAEEREAQNRR